MTKRSIGVGQRCRVKHIPGREKIPDAALIDLMKQGLWDTQIRRKYKVGIARLREVRRSLVAQGEIPA